MSLRDKFANLIEEAQDTVPYWRDIASTDFTRDLHERMRRMGITHAELARRMGTSRPYVTKLLEGSNFTLETMVKLAMALDGVLRVHIADRDALTHWKDERTSEDTDASETLTEDVASDPSQPRPKARARR
jgi:plasmid maintenance system antidote protein VapI